VNVDANGNNIPGDAANEPSIAIDPTDPNKIVIGWRQFDTVESNFRQAGWAYSHDAGNSWTFNGVLEPEVFRSDPVLAADAEGNFYYYSLTNDFTCDLFKSIDSGVSWTGPIPAFGGDKAWIAIDRTNGAGHGNFYAYWGTFFIRSMDGGKTFMNPIQLPQSVIWGTITVDPDGNVFIGNGRILKSSNAQFMDSSPTFELISTAPFFTVGFVSRGPNPGGLSGQFWIASDHSSNSTRGNLYALVAGYEKVSFARSTNGGLTWNDPVRINDNPLDDGSWKWFGTLSVAPNGRIDVFWNDTRSAGKVNLSELYYSTFVVRQCCG